MQQEELTMINAAWAIHFDVTTRVRLRQVWRTRRDAVADLSRSEPPDHSCEFSIATHKGEILAIRQWRNPFPNIFADDCC